MPECPELHLASVFVNTACAGVVFTGAVQKSEVSKGPEVPFSSEAYTIRAMSRGKEVRLTLTPIKTDTRRKGASVLSQVPMDVVFRFGMSGNFRFTSIAELPKHAHLRFFTNEDPQRVLSFVDVRRFGSWQPDGSWQKDRGPCVMFEYESFRENVLSNLSDKAFDRPVCEALLNQKYFNGIGNYLRAEILYRSNISPFMKARTVLEGLKPKDEETMNVKEEPSTEKDGVDKKKTENADLLSLCHTVPLEVVNLGGKGYNPEKGDYTKLVSWLQCYGVDGMKSVRDRNGRTMWFKGDPGPMAPKGSRSSKAKRKRKKEDYTDTKMEKLVKKEPGAGKTEKDVPKKQSGTRRQNASKTRLKAEAADDSRRPKACRKDSSTGVEQTRAKSTRRTSVRNAKTKAKATSKPRRKSSRTS